MDFLDGLGGTFIISPDPASLAAWYSRCFGFKFEQFGSSHHQTFWTLDPAEPSRRVDTHFAIMAAKVPVPSFEQKEEPSDMYGDQPFMLNLRIRDMDGLLTHLEQLEVPIIKKEDESYGRFAWVRDPDGHRIELYQPLSPPPTK
ncbi:MAG: VOC family protein [Myxococcota bacterium]